MHTNPHEIEETLHSLSVKNVLGPDGINNRLLRQHSKHLSNPLSDIFIFFSIHMVNFQLPRKRPISQPYLKGMNHQKYLSIDQLHFLI